MNQAAMNEIDITLSDADIMLTPSAQGKMAELLSQVEDNTQGIRVFATPGGCSGLNFGMTFTDQLNDDDRVREVNGVRVIVDAGTLQHVRGVEIDFSDGSDGSDGGDARFVFNNLQQAKSSSGCGTCGSQSGCSSAS